MEQPCYKRKYTLAKIGVNSSLANFFFACIINPKGYIKLCNHTWLRDVNFLKKIKFVTNSRVTNSIGNHSAVPLGAA
jgi:hypothetical protein